MTGTGGWIVGVLVGVLGFLGLLAASRAQDEAFLYGGYVLAAACLAYIFWTIKRHYDLADEEHARHRIDAERSRHH